MTMAGALSAAAIALVISAANWFSFQARWAKPRAQDVYMEYSIPVALKLVLSGAISLLTYGAIANLLENHGERWVSALLVSCALFCFYFTPATIVCSSDQVISTSCYGIKKVTINWPDVISIYLSPEDNSVVIRDKFDHTIVHTRYNVGRHEFVHQVSKLADGADVKV